MTWRNKPSEMFAEDIRYVFVKKLREMDFSFQLLPLSIKTSLKNPTNEELHEIEALFIEAITNKQMDISNGKSIKDRFDKLYEIHMNEGLPASLFKELLYGKYNSDDIRALVQTYKELPEKRNCQLSVNDSLESHVDSKNIKIRNNAIEFTIGMDTIYIIQGKPIISINGHNTELFHLPNIEDDSVKINMADINRAIRSYKNQYLDIIL